MTKNGKPKVDAAPHQVRVDEDKDVTELGEVFKTPKPMHPTVKPPGFFYRFVAFWNSDSVAMSNHFGLFSDSSDGEDI